MAALKIHRAPERTIGIVADRRLYLSADKSQVLEEGAADAAWLLATPGTEIPSSEVARLGLRVVDGRVVHGEPDEPAEPEPVADEGADAPEAAGADEGDRANATEVDEDGDTDEADDADEGDDEGSAEPKPKSGRRGRRGRSGGS